MILSVLRGLTAVLPLSLLFSVACATRDPPGVPSPPAGDPAALTVTGPLAIPSALDPLEANARACKSKISGPGLVCSRCPGDAPGADPECMASECFVDNHCLRCTDPKGRVALDCSIDPNAENKGSFSGPSNGEFNFASCTFAFGAPAASGTTCQYPGANTCKLTDEGTDFHCLSCAYANGAGSSVCADKSNPLYDPLIDRPDDFPATGLCVNDLGANGQIECTTCVHADLSVTRSCRYPGIVDCELLFPGNDPGCEALCTFKDGHKAKMCESQRGLHPVPI